VTGARAALVWSEETARLAREHGDANIISIGARNHTADDAIGFVDLFLATQFSQDERHERRIAMLAEYEETGAIADHETT
jgi:ribose 5-phosphate isomerase B